MYMCVCVCVYLYGGEGKAGGRAAQEKVGWQGEKGEKPCEVCGWFGIWGLTCATGALL